MLYERTEKYTFTFPEEYSYFNEYKDELEDAGVPYVIYGEDDSFHKTIICEASGIFDHGKLVCGNE